MKEALQKISEGRDLTYEEAEQAMKTIMKGEATDAQIGAYLMALKMKGEKPAEIAASANVMREFSLKVSPKVDGMLVDVCGTGGDHAKTFNISTTSMFVAAGAGVPIAKHGNRSITSNCGSADVLEALGVKLDATPERITESIEKVGIGFMFAPAHHAAMKHVMPARKQLGVRTIFNILGPLTNPAGAGAQVMGVFDPALTETLAEVFGMLGLSHALVVHGEPGLDEISSVGETRVSEMRDGKVNTYNIKPEDYGIERVKMSELAGGSAIENAEILKSILQGDGGARTGIVLLNAGAAIYVGGLAEDLAGGVEIARQTIESGRALKKLEEYVEY